MLTNNGMACADPPKNRNGPTRRYLGAHIFARVCNEHGIGHKLTKPYHPSTTDEIEQLFLVEAAIFRLPMDDHAESYDRTWVMAD